LWFGCYKFIYVLISYAQTFLSIIMTYFTSWEDFAKAAEMLYVNDPMKVPYRLL